MIPSILLPPLAQYILLDARYHSGDSCVKYMSLEMASRIVKAA